MNINFNKLFILHITPNISRKNDDFQVLSREFQVMLSRCRKLFNTSVNQLLILYLSYM